MGFAGDNNLGVIGKTTFFLISFSKVKGLVWDGRREDMSSTDLSHWNNFQNLPLPWRDFKLWKVKKVEVKFVRVQERRGVGS